MIATDPLSLLFIACFLTGMLFFIVTALLGNLGHGVTHGATHHAGLNIGHHAGGVHTVDTHTVSHGPAHTSGQAAGSHSASHGTSDRTGLLGKVSLTIQENGLGEIIYVSPGGMRKSIPARSIDGRRLERDQEVVVVNYQHGIAEVDTWDHFISEEGTPSGVSVSDELDKLRTLLDESSKADSQLVMRKDLQKE